MEGDKCARCGLYGEDRRTLYMACFYDLTELEIPFVERVLLGADMATLAPAKGPAKGPVNIPGLGNLIAGTMTCSGELTPYKQFTLFVCKACRAAWMDAIKHWFNEPLAQQCRGSASYGSSNYKGQDIGDMGD